MDDYSDVKSIRSSHRAIIKNYSGDCNDFDRDDDDGACEDVVDGTERDSGAKNEQRQICLDELNVPDYDFEQEISYMRKSQQEDNSTLLDEIRA